MALEPKKKQQDLKENDNDEPDQQQQQEDPKDSLGFFEVPKIIARYRYGINQESTFVEFEESKKCNGSLFIEGLTGIGTTSTVVAAHIIGELKLPVIAVFLSPTLPAMTSIHKCIPTSSIRIYGNEEICVAVGDYALNAVERSEVLWQVCQSLFDFCKRHECKSIISVDGFPVKDNIQKQIQAIALLAEQKGISRADSLSKDEATMDVFATLNYLSNDKNIALKLQELGHKGMKTMQIIGITGAMLQLAFCSDIYYNKDDNDNKDNNNNKVIPFTALLAPDPVNIPDRRGAVLVVKLLREIWNLKQIKIESLEKDAERLQTKVQQTVTEIASQMKQQRRIQMSKAAPPPQMYI